MLGGQTRIFQRGLIDSFPVDIARSTNGYFLFLEHRYYGKSMAMENLTLENLQYLTIEQTLADIHDFVDNARHDLARTPLLYSLAQIMLGHWPFGIINFIQGQFLLYGHPVHHYWPKLIFPIIWNELAKSIAGSEGTIATIDYKWGLKLSRVCIEISHGQNWWTIFACVKHRLLTTMFVPIWHF